MGPTGPQTRLFRRITRQPGYLFLFTLSALLVIFLFWNMPGINRNTKSTFSNSTLVAIVAEKNEEPRDKSSRTLLEPVKLEQSEVAQPKLDPENVFRDGRLLNLTQNDSRLLEFIREHHVFPPPDKPYNLTLFPTGDPTDRADIGAGWIYAFRLLKNKTKGFFIECGANDGEFLSNTLVLERDYGWTGLLIEGDPLRVTDLLSKNRKAWVVDTCLSGETYPMEVQMQRHKEWTAVTYVGNHTRTDYVPFTGKCLPLFSILSTLNVFEIDFFGLDIEDFEVPVLKTIPFDSVLIKVFIIEIHKPLAPTVVPFVESKGYICIHHIDVPYTTDYVFIHKSLYEEEMKKMSKRGCYW